MEGPVTAVTASPPPVAGSGSEGSSADGVEYPAVAANVGDLARLTRADCRDIAVTHRRIWNGRPALQAIYRDYYLRMAALMARTSCPTVEIGGGPGTFKTFLPNAISSDIITTPWVDLSADAGALPFADGSVGNLVMVDVLHHLPYPQRFLREAERVLTPGGRLVILDVYLSLMSWPIFRFLHPEPAKLSIRPLRRDEHQPLFDPTSPWNSDQGVARALFYRQHREFRRKFPGLRMIHRERLSTLLWPLSGGFGMKNRLPRRGMGMLRKLDRWLEWLGPLTNFRCLVALERLPGRAGDTDGRT